MSKVAVAKGEASLLEWVAYKEDCGIQSSGMSQPATIEGV